jgi:trehalose/maltose hydrolase-like predicted phosphorylase
MRPREQALLCQGIAVAREDQGSNPDHEARVASGRLRASDMSALLEKHARAWDRRWAVSNVVIEGDQAAQEAMRFALYHLIAAANPHDERVSIPARALTGDDYMGHVFWDTEIFLLPFYTFTCPEAARALLMYRYHTLPAARDKAVQFGYQGALYAWESAGTGQEVTPTFYIRGDGHVVPIRCGMEEHHISADIAYAIWQYWQVTGDVGFLLEAGAEIVLETARFWASRAMPEEDGRYHIRGVIGPDEYHEGVDDNAYTNFMARWNLECGRQVAQLLQGRWPKRWAQLREQLNISLDDLGFWHEVAAQMAIDGDPATGLMEQFTGFFQLEPLDLAAYEPRLATMEALIGRERTERSQIIKQADVVMLLALHWDRFAPEVREANFRFYEERCDHASSLSPATHALVAARLGDVPLAERYFHQAAAIDLNDAMGNAAGGVHIAALGGLWQVAVFGFAGMSTESRGLAFDPHLPRGWTAMRFPVRWHRRLVYVRIERDPLTTTLTLRHGRPFTVRIGSVRHRLRRGEAWTCRADPLTGGWKEGE